MAGFRGSTTVYCCLTSQAVAAMSLVVVALVQMMCSSTSFVLATSRHHDHFHIGRSLMSNELGGGRITGDGDGVVDYENVGHESRIQRRLQSPVSSNLKQFNVDSYGAKGDGHSDDSEAFLSAWEEACGVVGSVVVVPQNRVYLLGPTLFKGPCKSSIMFQLDGYVIAALPSAPQWGSKTWWINFKNLDGLRIQGSGTLDGRGYTWWTATCKQADNGASRCKSPTALKIMKSKNVVVKNITICDSPQVHLKFNDASQILVDGITIRAPADSINTDGIHIQDTNTVTVQNSKVSTGDDCVSIQTGSYDIVIKNHMCGPSHGISIGGLGPLGTTACVSRVTVSNVYFENSKGGVRIKTWQGGRGIVKDVSFQNMYMTNVTNPIWINQFYCDASSCKNSSNAVAVENISFLNIQGTYNPSKAAYQFACSDSVPCTGINVHNVTLYPAVQANTGQNTVCWKSYGSYSGSFPSLCLNSQPRNWYNTQQQKNQNLCPQY